MQGFQLTHVDCGKGFNRERAEVRNIAHCSRETGPSRLREHAPLGGAQSGKLIAPQGGPLRRAQAGHLRRQQHTHVIADQGPDLARFKNRQLRDGYDLIGAKRAHPIDGERRKLVRAQATHLRWQQGGHLRGPKGLDLNGIPGLKLRRGERLQELRWQASQLHRGQVTERHRLEPSGSVRAQAVKIAGIQRSQNLGPQRCALGG